MADKAFNRQRSETLPIGLSIPTEVLALRMIQLTRSDAVIADG